ncbi:MAG: HlyD family secretion protein [Acidobacteriota bacterium]
MRGKQPRLGRDSRLATIIWLLPWIAACSSSAVGSSNSPGGLQESPVVRRGQFRQLLLLTGELKAVTGEPIIVPKLPDWQTTIRWIVEDGAVAEEGDPLLELDTTAIASQLDDKRTARQKAINELAKKEAEVDGKLGDKEFAADRARIALSKAKIKASVPADVQARRIFQEAQLELEGAQVEHTKAAADLEACRESSTAELEVLRIDLAKAKHDLGEAQRAIDAMVLRAPRSGIVVVGENRREGRKFQVGDNVWIGLEVMEIPDLSSMMVEARLSDVDDGRVTRAMTAVCTLDAYPDRPVRGIIRSISAVAHEAIFRSMQRNFQVIVDLERSDPEIMRPGMSVKLEVETIKLEDVTLVPRAALAFEEHEVLALLPDGGAQTVELGPCSALECVLEKGLAEGTALRARR